MPARLRILTSPVRTTGGVPWPHAANIVASDAMARWASGRGVAVEWVVPLLAADLAGQYAVERDLARGGHDRASVDRDDFVQRARDLEAAERERAAAVLASLRVSDGRTTCPLDDVAVLRAARIAFVRLFEAGLLDRAERVVATCPRCATVVDAVDAEAGELESARYDIRFAFPGERAGIDVALVALELLPGVVAVAVPAGHSAEGREVEVPVVERSVPVLAADVAEPVALVPAHDAEALGLARAAGLQPIEVLDGDGTVVAEGRLRSMGRYAARAAAADILTTDHHVVGGPEPAIESCGRCRQCGTVVVPRLGWHWFLPMAELETVAADAVRQGDVVFSPPAAREAFLARAGRGGDWCLSHQVWSGYPVPAGHCLDCNQVAVAAELPTSCGKCMGPVVADSDVLDARFLGAVWPLAIGGWPDDEKGPRDQAPETLLIVGPTGLAKWALPMAALGVRLAAGLPFARIAVHPDVVVEAKPDADIEELVATVGVEVTRLALLASDRSVEAASALAARLGDAAPGDGDVEGALADIDTAMESATPSAALVSLAAAAGEGIPPEAAGPFRRAARPLLGLDADQ